MNRPDVNKSRSQKYEEKGVAEKERVREREREREKEREKGRKKAKTEILTTLKLEGNCELA